MLENAKITNGTLRLIVPFNLIKVDNYVDRDKDVNDKFMFHIGRDIVLSTVMNIDTSDEVNNLLENHKMDSTIEAIQNIKMYSLLYISRVQTGGLVLTFEYDWLVDDYEVFHDKRLHRFCANIIKDFMGLTSEKITIEEPFAYFNEADNNYTDEFDFIRSFNDEKLKNIKTILNDKSSNIENMESKMKILNEGSTFLFISVDGLWLSLNTLGEYTPEGKWIDHNTVAYNIVFYIIYNNIYNGENSRELSNLIINRENITSKERHSKLAKILSNNVIGILLARIIDIDSCCDYYNSRSIISEPIREIKKVIRDENDYAYDVIECIKNEICPYTQEEYEELINTFIQFNTERDNLESQTLQSLLNNLTAVNLLITISGVGAAAVISIYNEKLALSFSLWFILVVGIIVFRPILSIFLGNLKDFLDDLRS